MPAKLGILVIHGIGSQQPDFADEMIAEVDDRLLKVGVDPQDVCWQPLYWADLVQPAEDRIWNAVSRDHDLNYVKIRQFVISHFGDAIAYQRVRGAQEGTYQKIHDRIHENVAGLRQKLGDADKPLLILAHSLGCAMMSNYIWDRQHGYDANRFGGTAFERMETLAGIVTFGCNLPLFVLAYAEIVAIDFPPQALAEPLRSVARWRNYFDEDDVLGYPIKPLSDTYGKAVSEDIEINVGGLLTSWNPLSHNEYWTDDDFTKPVAKQIIEVLSVL